VLVILLPVNIGSTIAQTIDVLQWWGLLITLVAEAPVFLSREDALDVVLSPPSINQPSPVETA
jgi:hypothetical protein